MLLWSQSEEEEIDLEHTTVPFSPSPFSFYPFSIFEEMKGGWGRDSSVTNPHLGSRPIDAWAMQTNQHSFFNTWNVEKWEVFIIGKALSLYSPFSSSINYAALQRWQDYSNQENVLAHAALYRLNKVFIHRFLYWGKCGVQHTKFCFYLAFS